MKILYQLIADYREQKNCLLASGVDGELQGQKYLFVDGQLVFSMEGTEASTSRINSQDIDSILQTKNYNLCQVSQGQLFVERMGAKSRIIVCGAGTVGLEVIRLAKMLGLYVIAIEDREEYAERAESMGSDEVLCKPFETALETLEEGQEDYYIVLTREHQYDQVSLEHILLKKHVYVGLMSSKHRAEILKEHLLEKGFSNQQVEQLHSPIGLKIKAQTPSEIAVSIFAEVIQEKNSRERSEGFSKALLEKLIDHTANDDNTANNPQQHKDIVLQGETRQKLPKEGLILATLIKRVGSAPRDVGTKMLIYEDGGIFGSVGGGWIEADVIKLATQMFATGTPCALYESEKESEEVSLCGGYETIYLEIL